MHHGHGDEACKALRRAGYATLPVIAATGNATPRDTEYYFSCGFTAIISKPFTLTSLQAVLSEAGVLQAPMTLTSAATPEAVF
jgi:CheY-like chemotaxis protein